MGVSVGAVMGVVGGVGAGGKSPGIGRSPVAPAPGGPAPGADDPQRFAAQLQRDYPGLVAVLERRVGDRQLALDMLHDAIVTTLDKLGAGTRLTPEMLAGFVFRTALNHLRNRRRRDRLQLVEPDAGESLPADAAIGPAAQSQDAGMRAVVRRLLQDLSCSRDREILVRYYLDEEDKLALCESMALTGPQFDRVIFRARDRFRSLLERAGFGRWDLLCLALLMAKFVPFAQ